MNRAQAMSHAEGGFELNRISASLTILALMVVRIVLTARKAKQFPDPRERA